ncbi:MAG: phage tail protein I [Selenomonadaceae bacterium]|nr:phage tail protein I [Selenomonadaceae bacterium]
MNKSIFEARLTDILPESLTQDKKITALAAALDEELLKLSEQTRLVMHLPRLDELSGRILDLLADQFHVDFYEPLFLSDEIKRNIIRQSIAWHKIKGTRRAVEMVIEMFERQVRLEEWFEYGGDPFWFRAITTPFKSDDELTTWYRRIYDAKNVRSWCQVVIEKQYAATVYAGLGHYKHGLKQIGREDAVKINGRRTDVIADERRYIIGVPLLTGYVGFGIYKSGRKRFPKSGVVTIDGRLTEITEPDRTIIINTTQVIIRYSDGTEIILPLEDLIPDSDVVTLQLSYPSSARVISYPNPRADLTAADVKAVADFAIEHQLFLNSEQETPQKLTRATLVTKEEIILF